MTNRARFIAALFVIALTAMALGGGKGKGKGKIAGPSGFSMTWYTIDGGGGLSESSNFSLHGTIGQHDAGEMTTGGAAGVSTGFILNGGFWPGPSGPISCLADLDFNGTINVDDLLILIGAWGPTTAPADLNNSGMVNVDDLLLLIGAWGPCPA